MPIYTYKAKKGPKDIVTGEILAENKDALFAKLVSEGLVPICIEENVKECGKTTEVKSGKVRPRDLDIFTRQLSSLTRSGITMVGALDILSGQTENAYFKWVIFELEKGVKDGKPLSGAMAGFRNIFSPLYINTVKTGEEGGVLDEALDRLAEHMDRTEEIKSKISSALAYPILLITLGIGTVFVLLTFFMPRLISLFGELGQQLPLPTRILLAVSSFLHANWVWILLAMAVLTILLKRKGISKEEKTVLDWISLKIPVLGAFIRKENMAKFARSFALLLKCGVSVFKAVEIIIPTLTSRTYRDAFNKVSNSVIQGSSLANGMREAGAFNQFEISMLSVGEQGGRLEESLIEMAKSYERDLDKTLKIATSLIEPVIIIIMGGIVGMIVFAMLLPIFQINLK
ncbi:MAG: type II secretion system F family protein [Candidatus Omnitrophica bacterium]|nr:type II secretion system F family protein [Candidatus Omnitrophota bacterium]